MSAFQVGRIFAGGGSDIGFATTTDSGSTWTNGSLPGITVNASGTFDAASDAVVAFDAAHRVWMISSLAIGNVDQVIVNRSTDGLQWDNPVIVSTTPSADKNWIACDNTATSPYFGHCYTEWDDPSNQNIIWMSTSSDGGLTWGPALATADLATGIGGQPRRPTWRAGDCAHRGCYGHPDAVIWLRRRGRILERIHQHFDNYGSSGRRQPANVRSTVGRHRRGRHGLRDLAGLPLPERMHL